MRIGLFTKKPRFRILKIFIPQKFRSLATMNKILIGLFLILFFLGSDCVIAQKDTMRLTYDSTDAEQCALGKCYYYTHKLGFRVDTIQNERVYQMASNWLRTPYRWGGRTRRGIDCSDFASIIYDSCYLISISGACGDIYRDVIPIQKAELREGDLVFFKIWSRAISHVGVYLGKNKFVHASSGKGVVVSDLDEPYYKRYYFGGGRHKCF